MKIKKLSIENYRSIKEIKDTLINSFQALLGENNSGKSNILSAIEVFLTSGGGGVKASDFNDISKRIVIRATLVVSNEALIKVWRSYLVNGDLVLEKQLWVEESNEKFSVKSEYHGYKAEPKEWYLSIKKIIELKGERPRWKEIVEENGLPSYFLKDGSCNKELYSRGLIRFLVDNNVEYDEPNLSETQALGFQSNVTANLPKFYLLKAITDYEDEIDKRTNSSTFRRLMADLSDRIIKSDPKYKKIEDALNTIQNLLNDNPNDEESEEAKETRIESLGVIERKIQVLLHKLMPSVEKVNLKVLTDDVKTIFSKGVELTIDDGVNTDVLLKGHGLQRCIVFSLLQTLILNERNELLDTETINDIPIIIAIEEPELYIHPQLGKLFYDVMRDFGGSHQIIYTTHSPRFIDVYEYENIAIVSKNKEEGTKITTHNPESFRDLEDSSLYKGLSQLNSDINELFFASKVLLVEGIQDKIAIIETLKKKEKILNRTEELDVTIITTSGKGNMPFFIRVLNSFCINHIILHDSDITAETSPDKKAVAEKENQKIAALSRGDNVLLFPGKLEIVVGSQNHFNDTYYALQFFSNHSNINIDLENIIINALEKLTNYVVPLPEGED